MLVCFYAYVRRGQSSKAIKNKVIQSCYYNNIKVPKSMGFPDIVLMELPDFEKPVSILFESWVLSGIVGLDIAVAFKAFSYRFGRYIARCGQREGGSGQIDRQC